MQSPTNNGSGSESGGQLSNSEFALRLALSDLVEGTARSQQRCRYLELSRNEMAKEIVRLRHQNSELMSRLSQDRPSHSFNPPYEQNVYYGGSDVNNHVNHHHHQATTNGANNAMNSNEKPRSGSGGDDDGDGEYTIHDSSSSWVDLEIRLQEDCRRAIKEASMSKTNSRSRAQRASRETERAPTKTSSNDDNNPSDMSLVEQIAQVLSQDYSKMALVVRAQNERLGRLKSNHLRSYFQSQIPSSSSSAIK